ncbi:hypothetical protein [Streptomyces sp. enrichment culture]|uniref:hypothetical protein n=1 Tax=Streptomyces sp. enrichment culture TaxID=1795815 RepID=UPI003F545EF5
MLSDISKCSSFAVHTVLIAWHSVRVPRARPQAESAVVQGHLAAAGKEWRKNIGAVYRRAEHMWQASRMRPPTIRRRDEKAVL